MRKYGEESTDLGYVNGRSKFDILLETLNEAEKTLLYVRKVSTRSSPMTHQEGWQPLTAAVVAREGGRT